MASDDGGSSILLPRSVLECSPSLLDGVRPEIESSHRVWGCELIQEAGILLRLPQAVMVTAQTLFTRFYYRRSLRAFDAFTTAMSALFLGAKVEEQMKRVRDVLGVFHQVRHRRTGGGAPLQPAPPLQLGGPTYQRWKLELIKTERFILKELGFRLYAVMDAHPHRFLPHFVRALGGGRDMAQAAWSFLNDAMRTDCCLADTKWESQSALRARGKKMLSERRPHPRCAIVRALRAAPPRLKLTNPRPRAPHPSFLVALGVPGFPAAYD